MAKQRVLLETYCGPQEAAYADAHPTGRFGLAVAGLRKAVEYSNAKPGAGRPSAQVCARLLDEAIGEKEDAYWSNRAAIEAQPVGQEKPAEIVA
jgi:hypothetical protein